MLLPLLAAVLACSEIVGDPNRIVAIELVGSAAPRVEEGDTIRLVARALDAGGAIVSDAPLVWQVLDTGQVGITIDSTSGLITATAPGSWRVRARVDALASSPITVTVTPAPDSLAASGAVRDTLAADDLASTPLTVILFDLTTEPGSERPLADKSVHYQVVVPPPASAAGLYLTVADTVGADSLTAQTTTGSGGNASVILNRTSSAAADSAVIDATARRATGEVVAGSPVRFVVVLFR